MRQILPSEPGVLMDLCTQRNGGAARGDEGRAHIRYRAFVIVLGLVHRRFLTAITLS
jgi:hypothetical protein